jgi:multimeric flavodoxin WrbA
MKVLAIISSGRKKGHTVKMVSLLQARLEELAKENNDQLEVEKLFLADFKIKHCKGCRSCMDYGEESCPLRDDIPEIKIRMKAADAVVFASPVYVGDVNSAMKALIDRLAYICHRQIFYEKCAIIMVTTNATSLKRTIRTIGAATYSWGFKTIATKGFKTSTSNDSMEILKERYLKDISKLARKFYEGVRKKSYLNPSVISLASFKMQQKYRTNPELSNSIDYNYWNSRGWTDKKKIYYINIKVGFLKRIFSRILYCLLSIIF